MAKYQLKRGCSIRTSEKDQHGSGVRHGYEDGPVELTKAEATAFKHMLEPYIPEDVEEDEVEEDRPKPTRRRRASDAETVSDTA